MDSIIELQGVSKEFRQRGGTDGLTVVDVNLDVRPGEVLGIVGPTGAGKTTILRLIAGDCRPTKGRVVRGDGRRVTSGWTGRIHLTADGLGETLGPLLLYDEPLKGCPEPKDDRFENLVRRLVQDSRRAVVLATDSIGLASRACDRILPIVAGEAVAPCTPLELKRMAETEYYRFRVKGHLDPRMARWFDGLTLRTLHSGETMMSGPVTDQSALHGLLTHIRDLGLPLLEVTRVEPDLSSLVS